jgi:hypothetical protein
MPVQEVTVDGPEQIAALCIPHSRISIIHTLIPSVLPGPHGIRLPLPTQHSASRNWLQDHAPKEHTVSNVPAVDFSPWILLAGCTLQRIRPVLRHRSPPLTQHAASGHGSKIMHKRSTQRSMYLLQIQPQFPGGRLYAALNSAKIVHPLASSHTAYSICTWLQNSCTYRVTNIVCTCCRFKSLFPIGRLYAAMNSPSTDLRHQASTHEYSNGNIYHA